ncbi:MAG: FMN-binding negative transcriptional regulator [Streptosporangiaceae bacterium]
MDAAASADLVTFDGAKPVSTLLPVIWDRPAEPGDGDYGRVLAHLAIANDQWRTAQPGVQALVIVHGPQAYISPSWYESTARHGRTVPTWNYELVHLTGAVTFHHDPEWLREIVTRLTHRHEKARERPWTITSAPPDFIDGQLRAIVGVELAITSVEAKAKLGQNRGRADQASAVTGLRGEPGPGPAAVADLMMASMASMPDGPPG